MTLSLRESLMISGMSSIIEIHELFKHISQSLCIIFDNSLSLISQTESISKPYWFCLLNILQIPPLHAPSVSNSRANSYHLYLDHNHLLLTTPNRSFLAPSSLFFTLRQEPPSQNRNKSTSTSIVKSFTGFLPRWGQRQSSFPGPLWSLLDPAESFSTLFPLPPAASLDTSSPASSPFFGNIYLFGYARSWLWHWGPLLVFGTCRIFTWGTWTLSCGV